MQIWIMSAHILLIYLFILLTTSILRRNVLLSLSSSSVFYCCEGQARFSGRPQSRSLNFHIAVLLNLFVKIFNLSIGKLNAGSTGGVTRLRPIH